MNIFDFNLNYKIDDSKDGVIILGKIKSFHKGHQNIISAAIKQSANNRLMAMIYPDIDGFTGKTSNVVMNINDKLDVLSKHGFTDVMIFEPNKENYNTTPEQFVSFLKENLNVKTIIIGEDFSFGKGGNGDHSLLKEHFNTIVVDLVKHEGKVISTSWIIDSLEKGNIKLANELLGYNWYLHGEVVNGAGRGKDLGYPTANIIKEVEVVNIKEGVYVSETLLEGVKYKSLTSISNNPVFNDEKIKYETWLYEQTLPDFYGKAIKIELLDYIRKPIKFNNIELLKQEIEKDKKKAIKHFE